MRKGCLLTLLNFLCFYLFSQSGELSLQIKTDDKPSLHGFSYWQQIKVVSKDTSFTYKLHTGNPDVIKGLKTGAYKIAVASVFNHYISKKIELTGKTPLLKFTGLGAYYVKPKTTAPISQKIKLNDTLFIIYSNTKDETERAKIAVTRDKNGLKAIEYNGLSNEIFQHMYISDDTYKFVTNFENECKKAHSPKAETAPVAEVYTIELNKVYNTFIIPGEWKGIGRLRAPLFVVQQK